jgi:hypothetical protein
MMVDLKMSRAISDDKAFVAMQMSSFEERRSIVWRADSGLAGREPFEPVQIKTLDQNGGGFLSKKKKAR